jgi:hypothetical protein
MTGLKESGECQGWEGDWTVGRKKDKIVAKLYQTLKSACFLGLQHTHSCLWLAVEVAKEEPWRRAFPFCGAPRTASRPWHWCSSICLSLTTRAFPLGLSGENAAVRPPRSAELQSPGDL